MSNVRPRVQIEIRAIAPEDAEGFHACLDLVAREGKYLALLEAPPLEDVRLFVRSNVERGIPQVVALDRLRVVGWCDIVPGWHHALRHCGTLGMGLLPEYRGRGIGKSLFQECLRLAAQTGISRVGTRSARGQQGSVVVVHAARLLR